MNFSIRSFLAYFYPQIPVCPIKGKNNDRNGRGLHTMQKGNKLFARSSCLFGRSLGFISISLFMLEEDSKISIWQLLTLSFCEISITLIWLLLSDINFIE